MKIYKIALFFILILILSSCQKDKMEHTIAEGTVEDATTQQPIPNALVQLLASKRGLFSYGFVLVDSVRSDADGKYYFSFQDEEDFSYYLQALAKKHIDQPAPTGINNGKKNDTNLPLQPEAFLRIRFINVPPLDTIQEISMGVITLSPSPPQLGTFSGSKSFLGQVWGNTENRVIYLITKRGVETKYDTKVYCPAHDTTTFTIEY